MTEFCPLLLMFRLETLSIAPYWLDSAITIVYKAHNTISEEMIYGRNDSVGGIHHVATH